MTHQLSKHFITIASFLNVTPQMLSKIRKDITFDTQ